MTDTADITRRIELERSEARRAALEEAANALEMKTGNEVYRRAFRIAADYLRIGNFGGLKTSKND